MIGNGRRATRRETITTVGALSIGLVAGCVGDDEDDEIPGDDTDDADDTADTPAPADDVDPVDVAVETVADGLEHPWGMAFIPDSEILLVTERSGRLVRIDPATGAVESIDGVPSVHASGQGGLLDIVLWDDDETRWIYLTYSVVNADGSTTAVGRGTLTADANRIEDFETLYTADPVVDSTQHYGSRVVIGPDAHLYVTVGDRGTKNFGEDHTSQRLDTDLGSVLRLALDGSIPADNPFIDDEDASDAIYSYGHRNPQGLTIHPETEALWLSDHGEQDGDNITIVEEGGNHGWPIAHYGCTYDDGAPIGDAPDERDDVVDPVYYWECNSGGFPPAGMTFYRGDAFPDWDGNLFLGNLAGEYLGRFAVDETTVTEETPLLDEEGWRIRDVLVGPADDEIYVAVDSGSAPIVRLVPPD